MIRTATTFTWVSVERLFLPFFFCAVSSSHSIFLCNQLVSRAMVLLFRSYFVPSSWVHRRQMGLRGFWPGGWHRRGRLQEVLERHSCRAHVPPLQRKPPITSTYAHPWPFFHSRSHILALCGSSSLRWRNLPYFGNPAATRAVLQSFSSGPRSFLLSVSCWWCASNPPFLLQKTELLNPNGAVFLMGGEFEINCDVQIGRKMWSFLGPAEYHPRGHQTG